MIGVLPILTLLVVPSMASPLDISWEVSKDWNDQKSWRGGKNSEEQLNSWEDILNHWEDKGNTWEDQKSLTGQKGWKDDVGLDHKGWDSLSDSTLSVETHKWDRERRSLERIENEADHYHEKPIRESMETAEVNAIFMPAKFRLKKKTSYKQCRIMLELFENEKRRFSSQPSPYNPSRSSETPAQYVWSCNDFCCYPAIN